MRQTGRTRRSGFRADPWWSFRVAVLVAASWTALSFGAGPVEAVDIKLDPRATYLRTNVDPGALDATPVDLGANGFAPGSYLRIMRLGHYQPTAASPDDSGSLVVVFSGSSTLLPSDQAARVPDAIEAGEDIVTLTSFNGNLPTDIPQDFFVSDDRVFRIPSGATHLFVSVYDSLFGDNSDPNGDFLLRLLPGSPPMAAVVRRVSVAADGSQAIFPSPNGGAFRPGISADGRFVAFGTDATNLVPNDTNGQSDVFVHDRATGAIERVSVATNGAQADGASFSGVASLSADGRFVAFESNATNLVPNDTNGTDDIFVHDRQTGVTQRVSVATGGGEASGGTGSSRYSMSANGRFVAFNSNHTNLVTTDTNGVSDCFVHDRDTGATTRVSVATGGGQSDNECSRTSLSADGRFVAFASRASNLATPNTTPGRWHVYVHDRNTGITTLVSNAPDGSEGNADSISSFTPNVEPSDRPVLSGDGRFVAFASNATNLVEGDTNGFRDVFVRNLDTGVTERASVADDGSQAAGSPDAEGSWLPSISADGRYVAFTSRARFLVPGDDRGVRDIFVRDRQAGRTIRVNVTRDGFQGNASSRRPSLSANGRVIAFDSFATNLVPGDTNGDDNTVGTDVFLSLLRSFADVSTTYFAWPWVESLAAAGVTAGCTTASPPDYCPDAPVTREQMAVFLLKSKETASFTPPPCTSAPFADVPCSNLFAPWIGELVSRGVTAGCGAGNYCPGSAVTREQMAVFLLKALEGAGFTPPACTTAPFADVPCSSPFAPWIQELVNRGVTAGCGGGNYCPTSSVTRAQMAVFLVKTFDLPL